MSSLAGCASVGSDGLLAPRLADPSMPTVEKGVPARQPFWPIMPSWLRVPPT